MQNVIAEGKIGKVLSVHFEWLLNTVHGADVSSGVPVATDVAETIPIHSVSRPRVERHALDADGFDLIER